MKKAESNFGRVSGMIILICSIVMAILSILLEKNLDSFIMPFILLMVGITFTANRQSYRTSQPKITSKKQKNIFAALSISLMAGIVISMTVFFL